MTVPPSSSKRPSSDPDRHGSAAPGDGDTVRRLLAAYDAQLRGWAGALPPGARQERQGPLLRVAGMHRGYLLPPRELDLDTAGLDRLIAEQRDWFAARGESVEWKTHAHDLPVEVPERLRAAGFVPEPPETVMVADTSAIAAQAPDLPPGVVLRRISERADLERFARMQGTAFGEERPWRAEELARQIEAAPQETAVLVAEAEGEVISGARLEFEPGTDFAGLWGGGTLPSWRGRGVYRALVAARAALARDRGVSHLRVDASDRSAPVLRRLGFHALTTTTPYLWTPPEDPRG
ncbi:GNAT family N-acetyltransferase [Streptomyces sp. XM4193]|uniref:GNAT family N-acetyltransferase n=1 Tax=Streptomyces sp. XM4193 TaxID=2929782 RepID=UPI0027E373B6|nr:GNAT family N-acetyltransferase [Streptomyces sp. XM4193]